MSDSAVVLPSAGDADNGYVELARTPTGKVFRKQILKMNESFIHPGDRTQKITVDKDFAQKLVDNFKAGYCDIVQFPKVNDKNQHVEDPAANMGEVVDLAYDDTGVYAYIDARKNAEDIGNTYLGASAMMHLNYEDKITGNHVGPTLLHVAATNRPYLTNLAPYEAVSLSESDDNHYVILSSEDEESSGTLSDEESESPMDKLEQLLAELKDDFDIDVEALQKAQKDEAEAETAKAEVTDEVKKDEAKVEEEAKPEAKASEKEVAVKEKETVAASEDSELDELVSKLSDVLKSANPDLVSLSNSEVTISDVANGIIELSNNYSTLEGTVKSLNKKNAESEVEEAIRLGKVLPAQREAMVELKLSSPEMYDRLLPEQAIVALSNEAGISVHDAGNNGIATDQVKAEIDRITNKLKK